MLIKADVIVIIAFYLICYENPATHNRKTDTTDYLADCEDPKADTTDYVEATPQILKPTPRDPKIYHVALRSGLKRTFIVLQIELEKTK